MTMQPKLKVLNLYVHISSSALQTTTKDVGQGSMVTSLGIFNPVTGDNWSVLNQLTWKCFICYAFFS